MIDLLKLSFEGLSNIDYNENQYNVLSALGYAINVGDANMVQRLLEHGVSTDQVFANNHAGEYMGALTHACNQARRDSRKLDIVTMLVTRYNVEGMPLN